MARVSGFANADARARYEQAYDRTLATAGVALRAHDVPTRFGMTHVVDAGDEASPPLVLLHTMAFSAAFLKGGAVVLQGVRPMQMRVFEIAGLLDRFDLDEQSKLEHGHA